LKFIKEFLKRVSERVARKQGFVFALFALALSIGVGVKPRPA